MTIWQNCYLDLNYVDFFYDRLWRNDESKQTRLVFIGRELNQQTIQQELIPID